MASNGNDTVTVDIGADEGKKNVAKQLKDGAQAPAAEEIDFEKISIAETFRYLEINADGLTSAAAKQRLEQYGPNKLPEQHVNPILRFLSYMWNPLSWCMEIAAILAIILLDYADFVLIIFLLFLNACIGYYEESNADAAIKALANSLAPKAKALRDGKIQPIEAVDLVPGDIILIRLGDVVPADIKILGEDDMEPLQCDQAALTGESLPVKKFPGQCAFSGSTIKQGEARAVVYATGPDTFFGRAAQLIGQSETTAHLQVVMNAIGFVCIVTIVAWVFIELMVQFIHYKHGCSMGEGGCPTLSNILVIIVGGIPIAMPTVLSVTLAMGAYKLAREGAIVSRLTAVEELAGMDVLCSDKTGTLTLNKLTVKEDLIFSVGKFTKDDVLVYGCLSAQVETEEPIDTVLHHAHKEADRLWAGVTRLKYIPFNPVSKRTVAVLKDNSSGEVYRVIKGAPQIVLQSAHNYTSIKNLVEEKITEYAGRGYRALGIARADGNEGDNHIEFIGLVPLFDPPRHDTAHTIEKCLQMGIGVKMITGDQLLIGKETAKQLGMGNNMFTTEVFKNQVAGLYEGVEIEQLVEQADGFAEVFPEHKHLIVKILQERRHTVGMTGDGVNDAPALKKANIGIAVADATDAARGAADIVLTQPGLSTIITAVIGARKIFQRMKTYAKYTISTTYRICFTFGLLTVIYNWYFPTILVVVLAIFNDGAMIALSKDRVVPSHFPDSWRLSQVFSMGIAYGLYLTLTSWILFHVATRTNWFYDHFSVPNLNLSPNALTSWCTEQIGAMNMSPSANANTMYSDIPASDGITLLDQCYVEQKWMRASMARTLMYAYVAISGQALIFVVRTAKWSLMDRPGLAVMLAFAFAQVASSLIAAFGFNGYPTPKDHVHCQFNVDNNEVKYFSEKCPMAGSESVWTDSVIGCRWYVLVAWIWSAITYVPLDPLKWVMRWIVDEDGARTAHGAPSAGVTNMLGFAGIGAANLQRVSGVSARGSVRPAQRNLAMQSATYKDLVRHSTVIARTSAPPSQRR